MQIDTIYEEKIFAKGMTTILGFPSVVFLFLLCYQIFIEPIGDKPAPDLFFLFMLLIFFGFTIIFLQLIITITPEYINVGYRIKNKKIPFVNIIDCRVDERSNMRYGGLGIKISRIEGKWVLAYNLLKCPRVVLSLKEGKYKEFVFSTKNPEEVMMIIKKYIQGIK